MVTLILQTRQRALILISLKQYKCIINRKVDPFRAIHNPFAVIITLFHRGHIRKFSTFEVK